jgi:hypothetical protein
MAPVDFGTMTSLPQSRRAHSGFLSDEFKPRDEVEYVSSHSPRPPRAGLTLLAQADGEKSGLRQRLSDCGPFNIPILLTLLTLFFLSLR